MHAGGAATYNNEIFSSLFPRRGLKDAITARETTERSSGLICCILNHDNPQVAAAPPKSQNNSRSIASQELAHVVVYRPQTAALSYLLRKTARSRRIPAASVHQSRRSDTSRLTSQSDGGTGGQVAGREERDGAAAAAAGGNRKVPFISRCFIAENLTFLSVFFAYFFPRKCRRRQPASCR